MKTFFKNILSISKKAIVVCAAFFLVFALFGLFINKDKVVISNKTDLRQKNRTEIYKFINDKSLSKTNEGKISIALYRTSLCALIGEGCTDKPADGDKNFDKSLFGFMSKLIVVPMTTPPSSGVFWAYNGLQSAGFVPKTYASEGIGFSVIKPFANIWKIFRDFSYMVLVIVLIAIGFMVMFRMKMNPQTVISVENALPRIVIALILITFSFAIVGFLIDLMYVAIILLISMLSNNNSFFNATQFQNEYLSADTFHLFGDVIARSNYLTGGVFTSLSDALLGLFPPLVAAGIRVALGFATVIVLNNWVSSNILTPLGTSLNAITGVGTGVGNLPQLIGIPLNIISWTVIFLIGSTALFSGLMYMALIGTFILLVFRILGMVFAGYLKLIILLVISPFLLMFEAIPGRNVFSGWIKNIIGNLIIFPITITVFLISYIIVNSTVPAGYSDVRLPYLYGVNTDSFKILIGLGLTLIIPDLVKVAKEALGIKDIPISIGIGTFFGGAAAVAGGGMSAVGGFGSISLALGAFGPTGILKNIGSKLPMTKWMHVDQPGQGGKPASQGAQQNP